MLASGAFRLRCASAAVFATVVLACGVATCDETPYRAAVGAVGAVEAEDTGSDATDDAPTCCHAPSRFAALRAASASLPRAEMSVVSTDGGAQVLLDGELFAGYVTDRGQQPSVWPIIGPSGHEMTRSLPLGPARPAEKDDHPHHRSLWFAHGDVNGHDFWHLPGDLDRGPRIVHLAYRRSETTDDEAVVETENAWMAGDSRVLTDVRTIRFGQLPTDTGNPARYVDFDIRLIASDGDVTFGDTKEGTFAVRVPGPMKRDAGFGSRVTNDRGAQDGDAWGRAAAWVDYRGPLEPPAADHEPVEGGVLIMSHPESYRPECRWHVRGYGLFAANPFGESDFPAGELAQGVTTLAEGEELRLCYRVVFYAGSPDPSQIAKWFSDYSTPSVTPAG